MLSETIAQLREAREWSQWDLANAMGIDKNTVIAWEKGEVVPSGNELEQLASILDVSVDDLTNSNSVGDVEELRPFGQDPRAHRASEPGPRLSAL